MDCATASLSVALFDDANVMAAHHAEMGRGHAEALLPVIAALPGGGRPDRIIVNVGPGSFTGVRVGLAAARALGFAWDVPVTGYDCLDLVGAMAMADYAPKTPVVVAMTGGHGELFWKRIDPKNPAGNADAPQSTPIAQLADLIEDEAIYGSGAPALTAARGHGLAVILLPDARRLALLPSHLRNCPPVPRYGRGADAKPMMVPSDAKPAARTEY
jgi:tRNA threonylcarbamoyl adenosine modification protein YeaZ